MGIDPNKLPMVDRRKFIKRTALTTGALITSSILPAFSAEEREKIDDSLKPFYHGVASGDPLSTQVIIWTRVTPEQEGDVLVKWSMAKDDKMSQVVRMGEFNTNDTKDYTVKVDVTGLSPASTYYYQFAVNNNKSSVGRTKTTPSDTYENLQFAVVSCSDYTAGFYNALGRIAERKNLNAVIHLGDYIYEGTQRSFDAGNNPPYDKFEDTHFVKNKEWWLHSYRKRYALSRLDVDLRNAHQAHPFITVWDDHEIADNTYKDGALGHNPSVHGEWEVRKSAARQAYAEWLPIRGDASKIYRSFQFGKLMELIMVDTRVEGRDKQITEANDPALLSPDRTLLGKEQKQWLFNKLSTSPCQWKIVGNQVIFSEFNVKFAAFGGHFSDKVKIFETTFLDYWEGYPIERDEVINHIGKNKINNVVILSASMHCSLAFDVTKRATKQSRKGEASTYDPVTGQGSVAVEFATPSITSANFDEKIGSFYATAFESYVNKKLPAPLGYNPNPHMKFVDLQRHGYFVLKVSKERAEAEYYFVDSLTTRSTKESLAAVFHSKTGSNRLVNSQKS
jgi:alkaline phosphatase D